MLGRFTLNYDWNSVYFTLIFKFWFCDLWSRPTRCYRILHAVIFYLKEILDKINCRKEDNCNGKTERRKTKIYKSHFMCCWRIRRSTEDANCVFVLLLSSSKTLIKYKLIMMYVKVINHFSEHVAELPKCCLIIKEILPDSMIRAFFCLVVCLTPFNIPSYREVQFHCLQCSSFIDMKTKVHCLVGALIKIDFYFTNVHAH